MTVALSTSATYDRCAEMECAWSDVCCVFGKFECRAWIIGPKTPCIRNYNSIMMKSTQGHAIIHTCMTTKCMHRRLARRTRIAKHTAKHRAAETARDRFARARPTPAQMARASRAVHADMRDVLGLEDASEQ